MRTSNLPPQAYTKETLNKAFLWLKMQSDDIKAKATTTDSMVSYYLRHRRLGKTSFDSASSNAFQDDLKSLSKGFNDFEKLNQPSQSNVTQTPEPEKDLNEPEEVLARPAIEKQEELEVEAARR